MTQQEAKTLFIKHAAETIESWGFKEKKIRRAEAIYIKTKENGVEEFGVSTRNYMPMVQYAIGATKRLNLIENILSEINIKYALNLDLNKETFTIACFKNKRELDLALPDVIDEEGVIESSKILLDYIGNTVIPMFNLFDDIREIDKQINGEGENYWESDSKSSLPFSLGHDFFPRRLIIAWLCNNPRFDLLAENSFLYIEQSMEKHTGKPYHCDRSNLRDLLPATIRYLKDNVCRNLNGSKF